MSIANTRKLKHHIPKGESSTRWLVESNETPIEVKQKLTQIYETLNPADLKRTIEFKLNLLAKTYQTKHIKNEQKQPLEKTISVRFSNYPTGRVGLGSLAT